MATALAQSRSTGRINWDESIPITAPRQEWLDDARCRREEANVLQQGNADLRASIERERAQSNLLREQAAATKAEVTSQAHEMRAAVEDVNYLQEESARLKNDLKMAKEATSASDSKIKATTRQVDDLKAQLIRLQTDPEETLASDVSAGRLQRPDPLQTLAADVSPRRSQRTDLEETSASDISPRSGGSNAKRKSPVRVFKERQYYT